MSKAENSGPGTRGPNRNGTYKHSYEERLARRAAPRPLCRCGCGELVGWDAGRGKWRAYLPDHHRGSALERLFHRVDRRGATECWPFTGSLSHGYGRIGLDYSIEAANRVIAVAYHGPAPSAQHQARHLCGNRACCNPAHIAWGTQSENEMDKVAHGRSNRGERHGMHKLTVEQVVEIRRRCANGETQRALASRFGISRQSVSEIVTRRTWAWLQDIGEVMP